MNNLEIPDDLLMIACGEARDIYLNSVVKPLDIYEHDFSLRFEARMHKLIRKTKNSKKPGQVFWRVAAAIIIFLSVSFASLMSVEAYREKILEIITSVFKDRTEYRFSSDVRHTELKEVILGYVPEGLEKEFGEVFGNVYYSRYVSADGRFFYASVFVFDENSVGEFTLDTEDAYIALESYEFCEAVQVVIKNEETTFYWTDENLVFVVRGNLERETISRISEGISVSFADAND